MRSVACSVKGKMGSYGMLARRVVETETPVMVQVLKFESPCSYPQLGFFCSFSFSFFTVFMVAFL